MKAAGIPYVIFRPSFIFAKDGGILPTFAKLARLAPVTPIIGSGTQRIQPIWADDVGAYFAKAVELDAATDRTFELGGPDAVSWNEFWERLKRVRGITPAERARADRRSCRSTRSSPSGCPETSRSRATC